MNVDVESREPDADLDTTKIPRREEETSPKEASRSLQLLRQTLTSLAPIMATVSIGATFGYSAVLLPQLKIHPSNMNNNVTVSSTEKEPYNININNGEEESWIAASATILMAPGCWLSGILMEKLGRKKSQLLIGPIYLVAWLTVGFAPDFWALMSGRLLSGLCIGLQSPLGPVYVAETSEPRLRGLLLAGLSLAIAVGILISHVMGTWLSWRVAAHLLGIFPTLSLLASILAPESPAWLVKIKRVPEASEAWKYLRGNGASEEFEALTKSPRSEDPATKTDQGLNDTSWKSPGFIKPLIILNVFFLTAQFSGVNAVVFYCVQMIADFSGPTGPVNAHYATMIVDATRVLASLASCWLTRRYPRRVLALISGVGTALSLLILGGGLFFDIGKPWLPASLLFVYTCAVSIGLVPLPWLLCGEIFPAALRGLGSGLSSGFAFVCFFVVVKTGPAMIDGLGHSGTFVFYGSVTTAGTLFLYFFLPETKDKTLDEIEKNFTGESKLGDDVNSRKDDTACSEVQKESNINNV